MSRCGRPNVQRSSLSDRLRHGGLGRMEYVQSFVRHWISAPHCRCRALPVVRWKSVLDSIPARAMRRAPVSHGLQDNCVGELEPMRSCLRLGVAGACARYRAEPAFWGQGVPNALRIPGVQPQPVRYRLHRIRLRAVGRLLSQLRNRCTDAHPAHPAFSSVWRHIMPEHCGASVMQHAGVSH